MATIRPFRAYRYSEKAGRLDDLVTQPYDKISPDMQARYLAQSPYNLVRIILGERFETDNERDNVYTRAAESLQRWIGDGILVQDPEPAIYAYFQEFSVPDTGERLTRRGFIGLGAVEDYSEGVVHRHEQTLSGPKKDRRLLLESTRAHFGQIFMLYSDPQCRIDALLEDASKSAPSACVTDEYGTTHTLYRIGDADEVQSLMQDRKLLIADGHHRYETALNFRNDHPELQDAKWVMMTFVNMDSPGLRILATHRVLEQLPNFEIGTFLRKASRTFRVTQETGWRDQSAGDKIRIGVVHKGGEGIHVLERDREAGALDIEVLHRELIEGALGISAEEVREGRYLKYVRGTDAATDAVRTGDATVVFLVQPTTIQQVADCAFNGGCMPQKSTDFYPKLLSGLTIYRLME